MIEKYVEIYGEKYRQLIVDSLHWLEKNEPLWGLEEPINKDEFLKGLLERAK